MSVRRRGLPALVCAVLIAAVVGGASARGAGDPVVTVTVQGVGEIVIEPGHVECHATCAVTVPLGVEVTITATAARFAHTVWHGACAGTDTDTCVLQADEDVAVTVEFATASVLPPPTRSTATTALTTTASTTTDTTPPPPTTTTQPPPPPIGTLPGTAADVVSNAVRGLPVAFVAFNAPKTLGRRETATIQLLLSPPSKTIGELEDRLTEAGDKIGDRIKYSSTMEAVLRSQDFEIDPVDSEARKFIPADQDTEWLWQVTPKRTGDLRLFLTLYAIIDVAGKEGPVKMGTFHHTLTINVTWTQRAGDFVKENWKWLWTAILVPVGLWAIRKRAERKPPAPSSGSTEPSG